MTQVERKAGTAARRMGAAAFSGLVTGVFWAMTTGRAWAQTAADTAATSGRGRLSLLEGVGSTLLYGLIGIGLAIVGFKLFDVVIKHDIETEIFDNKNMAAALLSGAMILGVCIIIAATILSS